MEDHQGFDFDAAVAGYEKELQDQLRETLERHVSPTDLEHLVRSLTPVAQRYAGAFAGAVERRRVQNARRLRGEG